MKIEDAASLLGVPQNADLSTLRQAYRKLAVTFHPDKLTDAGSREKFQQLSLAYTKLLSWKRQDDDDLGSDEENDYTEEDVNEMRAFMRMFMDLVGIFSDEQSPSQDIHSTAGVPFGMSNVGSVPSDGAEDWSTEDEEDDDDSDGSDGDGAEENIFEPMAKSCYHMNLKEAAGQEKCDDDRFAEEELKRKLKNAKKKTEKRRKQKERKLKETADREVEEEKSRAKEELARLQQEELSRQRKEELKRAQELEAVRRAKLFDDAARGNLNEIKDVIDSNLMKCTERISENGKAGAGLVHYAVAPPFPSEENRDARLQVAGYLLHLKSPAIDLSALDETGCNILHLSAKVGDIKFVDTILSVRGESQEKRNQLDLNCHCLNLGYTALHYATEGGHFDVCNKLIDSGVLLNIQATFIPGPEYIATDSVELKGPTPLELAISKAAESGILESKRLEYRNIIQKLTEALAKIENAKVAKEREKAAREAKAKAEKEALLLKEQEEKELADRKQRQLKEKREKNARMRDGIDSSVALSESTAVAVDSFPASASKKKKKEKKKTTDKKVDAVITSLDSTSLSVHDGEQIARTQNPVGNRPRSDSHSSGGSGPSSTPALQSEEMNSKGELLNHLLAMGFPEEQCLAAISACGLNADLAISWIVDRPASQATTARAPIKSAPLKQSVASTSADNAAKNEIELRRKAQEEKEKLRRINREWNAKVPQQRAEEERKKVQQEQEARLETERKRMAAMLAPHLKFPPDIYPQTLDQAYGPGVVYAPGMPPPAPQTQYSVAPTYSYGGAPYAAPPYITGPPFVAGRVGVAPGVSVPMTAGALPLDSTGVVFPAQTRMQSWPTATNAPAFPPAPGLPLAPVVNLTPVKSIPSAGFSSVSSNPQYSTGHVGVSPTTSIGFPGGRARGPPSPSLQSSYEGQILGNAYTLSPEQVNVGSPNSPISSQEARYSDGALELSVSAREFVPKFAPTQTSMSPVTTAASAPSITATSQQGILGINLWNAGKGGMDDTIIDTNDMGPPSLIFPTDLGSSAMHGAGGSMGFEGLRAWGLSDTMDLKIPLESRGLGLPGSLGGGIGNSRFGKKYDDEDLDMDAALLGSDILGNLDDTDMSGVISGQRQSSSFLSSFGNLRDHDMGSTSSGFSSMFSEQNNSMRER